MQCLVNITIEGNLTGDPELGYAKISGKPYARLEVAVSDRVRTDTDKYIDGPATFYRVTIFGLQCRERSGGAAQGRQRDHCRHHHRAFIPPQQRKYPS